MRIVTWNCCRGAFEFKAPLLDGLRPLLQAQPAVVVGDFNSNSIWDRKRNGRDDGRYQIAIDLQLLALSLLTVTRRVGG